MGKAENNISRARKKKSPARPPVNALQPPLQDTPAADISLTGYVEHVTFHNPENHYTIARLRVEKTGSLITIVGYLPEARPGETVRVTGRWETHPRFGEQLKTTGFEVLLPTAVEEIQNYLATGFIPGIGPKTVHRITDRFGETTLDVIENDPERLIEVTGIGKKTARRIHTAWRQHHIVRELMRFFSETGISASHCGRVLKLYGEKAVDILTGDPYRIALDWPGTGFKIADTIAVSQGMDKNDPTRVKACLLHLVATDIEDGHTLTEEERLCGRCADDFDIPPDEVAEALAQLDDAGEVVMETGRIPADGRTVCLKSIFSAETGIAERLAALQMIPMPPPPMDRDRLAAEIVRKLAIQLSEEQQTVLESLLNYRVAVLTGGPGTGKTTLIRSLTAVHEARGARILLAAPTGRAAKRLSEISGRPAATLHRLLHYNLQTDLFDKNRDDPLAADVVIVDEASMVDTWLMYHLLEAVHLETIVVFVGDVYQLPPVGPGNVLADMIQSGTIPTLELTRIFRQARESPIIINAHRVRQGKPLQLPSAPEVDGLMDFYFIRMANPTLAATAIAEMCADRIPERFHLDPVRDIQVITPMHKGDAGTLNLNRLLQRRLNAAGRQPGRNQRTFYAGDKVMHLKNNYQKDIFNGDIGMVSAVDKGNVSVNYDGRIIEYDAAELDDLTLAYAISVHKSQGSEYPAVILPLFTQHYALLQRNLLYTAITRGKQLVVIVGTPRAVDIALANDRPRRRLTGLARRLQR